MSILPRLRQQRLWLAFFALALCLPWLATVGSGQCLLRSTLSTASAAPAQPAADHCPRCCPPSVGTTTPDPSPRSPDAAFCCETFKAFLPLEADASDLKWLASGTPTPDASAFLLFASLFIGVRLPDAIPDPGLSRPIPPSAFLRTVSRRCFPSHAPPFASALLS